jgi:hypothetical protein
VLLITKIIVALHFLFVNQDATTVLGVRIYQMPGRQSKRSKLTLRTALISSCDTDIDERYVVMIPCADDIDLDDDGDDEEA